MADLYIHMSARAGAGISETVVAMAHYANFHRVGVTCEFHPGLFLEAEPDRTAEDIMAQFLEFHHVTDKTALFEHATQAKRQPFQAKRVSKAAIGRLLQLLADITRAGIATDHAVTDIQKELEEWRGF